MSKLENGLKEWVELGFISPEQAKRIQDHESTKPESSWILSGLLILGALIIGIGVISLIAANWDEIPVAMKLGGDFLLLGGLAFATYQSWVAQKPIQFEVLLLSFLVHCLASIGLISQVFHTGGELYQAILLWSLITAGAAMAARQFLIPFLWAGAFLSGVAMTAFDSSLFESLFQKNHQAVFMAIPLLSAGLTGLSRTLASESGPTRAFRAWTLLGGLIALATAELHDWTHRRSAEAWVPYFPGYLCAGITLYFIWNEVSFRRIQKLLLTSIVVTFLIPSHLAMLGVKGSLAYAIFTVIVLGLMAVFMASQKERKIFQWLLFLVGLRFLIFYFEVLGGLAATGFGLIVSGGVVIGLTILWNKYRKTLASLAERWVG